jgi:hypothetical protein
MVVASVDLDSVWIRIWFHAIAIAFVLSAVRFF